MSDCDELLMSYSFARFVWLIAKAQCFHLQAAAKIQHFMRNSLKSKQKAPRRGSYAGLEAGLPAAVYGEASQPSARDARLEQRKVDRAKEQALQYRR